MRSFQFLALAAAFVASVAGAAEPAQSGKFPHRVILQGNGKLAIVGVGGKVEWELPWKGIHDIHVLPGDGAPAKTVLVQQGAAKIAEIDLETKEVVWSYDSANSNGNAGKKIEVHAFQPLADGRVMIAESGAARIIEIDRSGKLLDEVKLKVEHPHPHTDTRLVRKLSSGNYLVCHEGDGALREYDSAGTIVWEYRVPLFNQEPKGGHGPEAWGNKSFAAVRLPSGNTLLSTGNGHGLLEVTPKGEIVWQLTQRELPGIVLAWVTTLEVLPSGNIVLGNCHAGSGQPVLVEIEPKSKRVVAQFDGFAAFGNNVSNSQLLGVKTLR